VTDNDARKSITLRRRSIATEGDLHWNIHSNRVALQRHTMASDKKVEIRAYRCPGCNAELPVWNAAAVSDMTNCAPLQDMIAVGSAGYMARSKRKLALCRRSIIPRREFALEY
jgi:hypothetical protein